MISLCAYENLSTQDVLNHYKRPCKFTSDPPKLNQFFGHKYQQFGLVGGGVGLFVFLVTILFDLPLPCLEILHYQQTNVTGKSAVHN